MNSAWSTGIQGKLGIQFKMPIFQEKPSACPLRIRVAEHEMILKRSQGDMHGGAKTFAASMWATKTVETMTIVVITSSHLCDASCN